MLKTLYIISLNNDNLSVCYISLRRYTKRGTCKAGGRGRSVFMNNYSEVYFNLVQQATWDAMSAVFMNIPYDKEVYDAMFQPVAQMNIAVVNQMNDAAEYLQQYHDKEGIATMFVNPAKALLEKAVNEGVDDEQIFDSYTDLFDPNLMLPLAQDQDEKLFDPKTKLPYRRTLAAMKRFMNNKFGLPNASIIATAVLTKLGYIFFFEDFLEGCVNDIVDHRMFALICTLIGTLFDQWSSERSRHYLQQILDKKVKLWRIMRNKRLFRGNSCNFMFF